MYIYKKKKKMKKEKIIHTHTHKLKMKRDVWPSRLLANTKNETGCDIDVQTEKEVPQKNYIYNILRS